MFYAQFVLAKKGPLARIWLAAHWDKKLTKAHVFETNIEASVEGILQPKVKMALRTSGHLLLGVVRIYSRKAKYLLADCNEAFIKIKMAFRPGMVDLPEENREAAVTAITLPEVFHDFDTAMPDLTDIEVQAQFTLNQSRAEEITMPEDYGNNLLSVDDEFEMGFNNEAQAMDDFETSNPLFTDENLDIEAERHAEDSGSDVTAQPSTSVSKPSNSMHTDSLDAPIVGDGFGGIAGQGYTGENGLFEGESDLFGDGPLERTGIDEPTDKSAAEKKKADESDDDDDDFYGGDMGPPSNCPSSGPSSPASPPTTTNVLEVPQPAPTLEEEAAGSGPNDQTTLIQNEDETFALAPLETTITQGAERSKTKRKRKLIIDEVKNISGEEMKSQLSDTTDIVTTLDLAPPTKRLMHWKETGGVEKLFALPGRPIHSRALSRIYQRHLTTRAVENEDFGVVSIEGDKMELEFERPSFDDSMLQPPETPNPRKRKFGQDPPSVIQHHQMEQVLPPMQQAGPSQMDLLQRMEEPLMHPRPPSTPVHMEQHRPGTAMSLHSEPEMPVHMDHAVSALSALGHMSESQVIHHASQYQPQLPSAPIHQFPIHHPQPIFPAHIPASPYLTQQQMPPSLPSQFIAAAHHLNPSLARSHTPDSQYLQHPVMNLQSHPLAMSHHHHQQQLMPPQQSPPMMPSRPPSHLPPQMHELPQQHQIELAMPPPTPLHDYPHIPSVHSVHSEPNMSIELAAHEQDTPLHLHHPQTPMQTPIHMPDLPSQHDMTLEAPVSPVSNMADQSSHLHPNMDDTLASIAMQDPNTPKNFIDDDDDHDMECPPSVGPPDEQGADETYEQFEERVLNKRAQQMYSIVQKHLVIRDSFLFSDMITCKSRKMAAQKFYSLLVLKKQQAIELDQAESFSNIVISAGPKLNSVY